MQDIFVLIIISISTLFLFLVFYYYYSSLLKDFSDDNFVIKLRNGQVSTTFQGGSTRCLPIIDDIILIPTKIQMTDVEIINKSPEKEKCFDLKGLVSWNVKDPLEAFLNLSWDPEEPNYAEAIIKNMTESKLKIICDDKSINYIIKNENVLIDTIILELRNFFTSCSITISSLTITDIDRLEVYNEN